VAVGLGARALVLPGLPAVRAPHNPAQLYADHHQVGSACEGAMARTWEVQGRGGKLQVGAEGRFLMPSSSRQEAPPSRLTNSAEGSVPA
jgi:hypothetical protein